MEFNVAQGSAASLAFGSYCSVGISLAKGGYSLTYPPWVLEPFKIPNKESVFTI